MFYSITADIVVFLHFLWIIFLIFGAFLARRYKWVKIIHIGGLSFAFFIQIIGWYCPFTHLEVWLRKMHDPSLIYSGSFIIHYVEKIVYIGLSPKIILLATLFIILISLAVYLYKPRK